MQQKIIISVISDLVTDQRVHKVATTLHQNGYDVFVVGAKKSKSKALEQQLYKTKRIALFFEKGFLQYAEWNTRLFFYLLFKNADIFLANDLDTLLPNYIITKWKNKKLVYDSHEYFTEQLEIQGRNFVKKTWLKLERFIFPKLKNVYTVNDSIAKIYTELYKVKVGVVRNVPLLKNATLENHYPTVIQHLQNKKIVLTQGSGFNVDRGLAELIDAMEFLPEEFVLLIIGRGLAFDAMQKKAAALHWNKQIMFMDVLPPLELKKITPFAFCAFTLDKPTCLNYYYSLPNKLFDFIMANVPIIASNLPEVANIVQGYKVGIVIKDVQPKEIANAVLALQENESNYTTYKQNCNKAMQVLNWQEEEKKLIELFKNLQ